MTTKLDIGDILIVFIICSVWFIYLIGVNIGSTENSAHNEKRDLSCQECCNSHNLKYLSANVECDDVLGIKNTCTCINESITGWVKDTNSSPYITFTYYEI
jgi:hypothetical protein